MSGTGTLDILHSHTRVPVLCYLALVSRFHVYTLFSDNYMFFLDKVKWLSGIGQAQKIFIWSHLINWLYHLCLL